MAKVGNRLSNRTMTQTFPRVFKPRLFVRLLGWGFIFGWGGALAALLVFLARRYLELSSDDLWAAFGIGVFLLLLVLGGAALLRTYFVLGADYLEFVRPYGTRRFAVSELAGYSPLIMVFHLVPTLFIRLYRRAAMPSGLLSLDASIPLKEVIRIPVSFADRAEVEDWCAQRLPLVDDPGSPLRPKPHFRNTASPEIDRKGPAVRWKVPPAVHAAGDGRRRRT